MKWEYLVREWYGDNPYELDQMGEEGWELVAVNKSHSNLSGFHVYFFKRPKQEPERGQRQIRWSCERCWRQEYLWVPRDATNTEIRNLVGTAHGFCDNLPIINFNPPEEP